MGAMRSAKAVAWGGGGRGEEGAGGGGEVYLDMPHGKPRPQHRKYLEAQERLGFEGRVLLAFRASAEARAELKKSLREVFPALSEQELHALFLKRLSKWQNRNY